MTWRSSALAFLLAASTWSLPAAADEGARQHAEPPSPSATVAEHIRRGHQARKAAKWAAAVDAYQTALASPDHDRLSIAQRATLLGELGMSELALGKHRDAAEHFYMALKHRDALPRAQQKRYEQGQRDAERKIAVLIIGANPPDAEVLVDGKSLGTPRPTYLIFVEPGTHVVRARLAGHGDAMTSLDTAPGSMPTVALTIPKAPPALSNSEKSEPVRPRRTPATTTLGRDMRAAAPASAAPLRAAGFAGAAAGLVLGTGFGIAGELMDGQVEERAAALGASGCAGGTSTAACRDLRELVDRRDAVNAAAFAALIGSAVVGGAALTSFWWAPSERALVQVRPMAASSQIGATVTALW